MPNVTRRVFIGASAYLVSATLLVGAKEKVLDVFIASEAGQFFSAKELSMLNDIANIMIPSSDTPGAVDANVVPVLDALMLTWASEQSKRQFVAILKKIDQVAKDTYTTFYLQSSLAQRSELLVQLDKQAFTNRASELSGEYRKLKEIIFHLYYTSKEANPDYVPIPGSYRGCLSKTQYDVLLAQRRLQGSD